MLIFGIPGILILFLPVFKKISIAKLLIYIIGISICFWICSFWVLKGVPLQLKDFILVLTFITVVIAPYFLYKKKSCYEITISFYDFILIGIFLFILFLRLLPMFYSIVAAGADMSMHTYITNLIVKANGVPENYYPILGIDSFNSYPVGFHTLSALISLLGGILPHRATFIMSSFTHAFLTISLFLFLARFVSQRVALFSSICFTFFTANPQNVVAYGGNPLILTLTLFIFFMALFNNRDDFNKWLILFSALSLAAVLLTHVNIFVQSIYMFGAPYIVYSLLRRERKKEGLIKSLWVVFFFFLMVTPYLFYVDRGIISSYTLRWIRDWVSNPVHGFVWKGSIFNFVWTIPFYIVNQAGIPYSLIFFSMAGLIALFYKDKKIAKLYTCSLITGILLILNIRYWVLPFSYAIYPERVAIMTLIPLSLFFAYAIHSGCIFFSSSNKRCFYLIICAAMILMCVSVLRSYKRHYFYAIEQHSSVTASDMKAFEWLKDHTSETDVIKNNYGDAGLWIPAIISRPITSPHVNVVYLDKIKQLGEPKYIYIGKKRIYSCNLKDSAFRDNVEYEQVYSQDGVYIYKKR